MIDVIPIIALSGAALLSVCTFKLGEFRGRRRGRQEGMLAEREYWQRRAQERREAERKEQILATGKALGWTE